MPTKMGVAPKSVPPRLQMFNIKSEPKDSSEEASRAVSESPIIEPGMINVLDCSDEEFTMHLDLIKAVMDRKPEMWAKRKKTMKGYSKRQLAVIYEELSYYQAELKEANCVLGSLLEKLNVRINALRLSENLLHDYYRSLEGEIESVIGYETHKKGPYHRQQRDRLRIQPSARYSKELDLLDSRKRRLLKVIKAINMEERQFRLHDSEGDAILSKTRVGGAEAAKLEEMYHDAATAGGSHALAIMRMRALQPLIKKEQELRFVPPLSSSEVQSLLQKELVLPFSVRVLALHMERCNNIGDRFVQWYINNVVDSLAMAQLVELVPREHVVTTTLRLASVCDMYLQSRQDHSLPDISHVVLQAIAEGRSEAFASLLLSPSSSCIRALGNKEDASTIFFTAVLTGRMEVIHHLMSIGFYNTNALTVFLFFNPNVDDAFYAKYMTEVTKNVKRLLNKESSAAQENVTKENHKQAGDEELNEVVQLTLARIREEWDTSLFTNGLCENLRHFLLDRNAWRRHMTSCASRVDEMKITESGEPGEESEGVKASSTSGDTMKKGTQSDVSFSSILSKRKLDRLLLSTPQCAVLPPTSTAYIRRVDPWGYTPLEATSLHLLLIGNTSTAHAHVVQLPVRRLTSWNENEAKETQQMRNQREQMRAVMDCHATRFYYEAHISLNFLIREVLESQCMFTPPSSAGGRGRKALPPLQRSSVYVGWGSDELVTHADGRNERPPLGSDSRSVAISFDVVHVGRVEDSIVEIVLRPMKHALGITSSFAVTETPEETSVDQVTEDQCVTLVRILMECSNCASLEKSLPQLPSFSNEDDSSTNEVSPIPVARMVTDSDALAYAKRTTQTSTTVPSVIIISVEAISDNSTFDEVGFRRLSRMPTTDFVTLLSVPVYKSKALVVGCYVDLLKQQASFSVNGTSLGVVFTSLPSRKALRPAVSLRSSPEMTAILQCENPSESVIVRFVFNRESLMAYQSTTEKGRSLDEMYPAQRVTPGEEQFLEYAKKAGFIPGMFSSPGPLLFDQEMMQCSLIRLITGAERATATENEEDVELLRGGKNNVSLGTAMRVNTSSIRKLLNTPCDSEELLFFPSVTVKRRSDESDTETNRVIIIPEDTPLTPLCIALSMRQRVAAYHIAVHPLTDFQSQENDSQRQKRMAVLASAALGYEETLYVLLQRIPVSEIVGMFAVRVPVTTKDTSTRRQHLRIISANSSRKVVAATALHRVEYTPLHCALLEGHRNCAHLILFYLNRALNEEYLRHAVNVISRSGEAALLISCRHGYVDIAQRLLAMGATPSTFDRVTRSNCLELACAGPSEEIALSLLQTPDYHSPVTVNNAGAAPPLCWCALNNAGSLIEPLLRNGANPNIKHLGPTPLILAVMFDSQEVALELLKHCDSSAQAGEGTQVAKCSLTVDTGEATACSMNPALEQHLFRKPVLNVDAVEPRTQGTALHLACELGQLEVVRSLIGKGASLKLQNKMDYSTPLHLAIKNGHEELALEIIEYAKNKMRRGYNVLDISAISKSGDTPLHIAAREGMLAVIEYIMFQFSEEEVARLDRICSFTKRPTPVNVLATNRKGRSPLLEAIYAHQEEAARLIASLMPEYLSNPGGPAIDGTSLAVQASDKEGLDSVTLFFLSHPNYVAAEDFRKDFFARYNAKRLQMDMKEDNGDDELVIKRHVSVREAAVSRRHGKRRRSVYAYRQQRTTFALSSTSVGTSMSISTHHSAAKVGGDKHNVSFGSRRLSRSQYVKTTNNRIHSTFMKMLLAKGIKNPTTRKAIQFLQQGFALEELYAMLEVITAETTRTSQSHRAMQYIDAIISFLHVYVGVHVAPIDAVLFVKKLLYTPILSDAVTQEQLAEAKQKLIDTSSLCREIMSLMRTRGPNTDTVADIRQLISQCGLSGDALRDELTSPFGYTVLQLAATLSLSGVCTYLITECRMSPLYVPPISIHICKSFTKQKVDEDHMGSRLKWLLTPFRLAIRALNEEIVTLFLCCEGPAFGLDDILDSKEHPMADPLQQTALQELLRRPLDSADRTAILDIVRFLLRSGAAVQGNTDAEGNDAWMLAVRSCPGRGTILQIFLEEQVDLCEDDSEKGSLDYYDSVSVTQNVFNSTMHQQLAEELNKFPMSLKGAQTTSPPTTGDSDEHTLTLPALLPTKKLETDSVAIEDAAGKAKELEIYYARLVFSCAEHNPQLLTKLLQTYSRTLSPLVLHPTTGDTLLTFLLRRASNIYAAECGFSDHLSWSVRSFDTLHTEDVVKRLDMEASETQSSADGNVPYRDPVTVPSVRVLLFVVEGLLQSFSFDNMYYEHENGYTALALAARLSYNPIVTLIVCQESFQFAPSRERVHSLRRRETLIDDPPVRSISSSAGTTKKEGNINHGLQSNLKFFYCWMALSNCLYYDEEDINTLLTILRHLKDSETRYSFLQMVYCNLHPMVALHVAVLYTNAVKRILMRPMAVSAFWCSVFYAQFVGRLEEVSVEPAQWRTLLSVLLPMASPLAIYILKAMPSFPATSSEDLLPSGVSNKGCCLTSPRSKKGQEKVSKNWKAVLKGAEQYIRQIAAAAVCIASPSNIVPSIQTGKAIPTSQRAVFSTMAAHFHEVVELAVRFDNCALLTALVNTVPGELQPCTKFEWRYLVEGYHFQVVAVAAGSVNVLDLFDRLPDTAPYMNYDHYNRIDIATGIPETLRGEDHILGTDFDSTRRTPMSRVGALVASYVDSSQSLRVGRKANDKVLEGEHTGKKNRESRKTSEGLSMLDVIANSMNTEGTHSENSLHYADVLSVSRERKTVAAMIWGIGVAARPIVMNKCQSSAEDGLISLPEINSVKHSPKFTNTATTLDSKKKKNSLSSQVTPETSRPATEKGSALQKRKDQATPSSTTRQRKNTGGTVEIREEPRYFPYYLCDWALHTTLLLHAPHPSIKAIDTLLYLMEKRAPLSSSAVHMFLVASRPVNNWMSSSGERITLSYTTASNRDSLLHLLVQNDQLQLTRYFLAAALCYFICYQYDPPCEIPLEIRTTGSQCANSEKIFEFGKATGGDSTEEDGQYPSVFLRNMMRRNKHGLTPFDYARGPMVGLLQEYGCVPPTYRANPRSFCRDIRLSDGPSDFLKVPQIILASQDFVSIRDDVQLLSRHNAHDPTKALATDAVIQRNQTISNRDTRQHLLPSLLADDVSLLHLGLCSADDVLVLESIESKRQKQHRNLMLVHGSKSRAAVVGVVQQPVKLSIPVESRKNAKRSTEWNTKNKTELTSPTEQKKNEKETMTVMGLIEVLRKRGIVTCPLLLPLEVEEKTVTLADDGGSTAILLAMTPMAIAIQNGAIKHGESNAAAISFSPTFGSTDGGMNAMHDSCTNIETVVSGLQCNQLPPYNPPQPEHKTPHPASALEAWLCSRKMNKNTKKPTPALHENTTVLIKALEKGTTTKAIRSLGLLPSQMYDNSGYTSNTNCNIIMPT
ncbi:hypothetical protein TRVL_04486 [Trypanosoma vivax]|nr:hypothetical protein TRVL_04486 [Trypanosoma vivax]